MFCFFKCVFVAFVDMYRKLITIITFIRSVIRKGLNVKIRNPRSIFDGKIAKKTRVKKKTKRQVDYYSWS